MKITLNPLGLVASLQLGSPPLPLDGCVLTKFSQILGIPNNAFKPNLFQKFSRIKVYNALAAPILLYASEIWTLREKDKND